MSLQLLEFERISPHPERAFERYAIELSGKVTMIGHRLSMSEARCRILDISCGGAKLKVQMETPVPSSFFLQIEDLRDEVGCAVVSRPLGFVGVRFNMLLSQEYLAAVLERDSRQKSLH